MRDRDFEQWLRLHYRTSAGTHLDPRSQSSTLSNCRRVERGEGDLDRHYTTDGLTRVLRRLTDGTAKIRAEGNRERVLSSLKSAVSRYEQFCREWPPGSVPAVSSAPPAVAPAGFALPATVTMDEAAAVLRGVERALPASGALRIDASALAVLDTGAIALLLQARRLATSRGLGFELAEVPDKLAALARLYGVATLLGIAGDDKAASRAAAAG